MHFTCACGELKWQSVAQRGVSEHAKDLKRRIKPTHKSYSTDDELQQLATYKKTKVILYNNIFERIKTFEPVLKQERDSRKVKRDPLEIQIEANHYKALLRRSEIGCF